MFDGWPNGRNMSFGVKLLQQASNKMKCSFCWMLDCWMVLRWDMVLCSTKFSTYFSRYELKIYILKNKIEKIYINGPIWTENPDFSKSSAENISRRKYVVNFMFAHNVHVIEVKHYACLKLFNEMDDFGSIWASPGMIMSKIC